MVYRKQDWKDSAAQICTPRMGKQKTGGTEIEQFWRMPPRNSSDQVAPVLIWGRISTHKKKNEYIQKFRKFTLETQVIEGYRIIYVSLSLSLPLWEPCAYMLAVQSYQLSAFLTEGPLFQTAKLKRDSLIKSHWDQYSQLVQGLMPFHNTPYRKSLEIHSWLISTAGT